MIGKITPYLVGGWLLVTPALAQPAEAPERTVENLRTATRAEANAAHRYELFARRADAEGLRQVAELFRAVALSERVHRRNHEAVLRRLGQPRPRVELADVDVRTTRENLLVPIRGEGAESEETYPAFMREAIREGVPAAALSFRYARDAEAGHVNLFTSALESLGDNPDVDYWVNAETGMLRVTPSGEGAPVTAVVTRVEEPPERRASLE